jgi:secondary thiamine-phosphate synthase enzyme
VDDNAAAHIKAAIVGPSETIPVQGGRLVLGTWQNVFLCEFDGPRAARRVVVSVLF